eukprot:647204_1
MERNLNKLQNTLTNKKTECDSMESVFKQRVNEMKNKLQNTLTNKKTECDSMESVFKQRVNEMKNEDKLYKMKAKMKETSWPQLQTFKKFLKEPMATGCVQCVIKAIGKLFYNSNF